MGHHEFFAPHFVKLNVKLSWHIWRLWKTKIHRLYVGVPNVKMAKETVSWGQLLDPSAPSLLWRQWVCWELVFQFGQKEERKERQSSNSGNQMNPMGLGTMVRVSRECAWSEDSLITWLPAAGPKEGATWGSNSQSRNKCVVSSHGWLRWMQKHWVLSLVVITSKCLKLRQTEF